MDLKEFVHKKQPRQVVEKPLMPQNDKDKNVCGNLHFELINEEAQSQNLRTVTAKINEVRGAFDDDFLSLDHKMNMEIFC